MFRKIFQMILAPRHPWRTVSFSELSEMYLSGFLRTLAIGMIGVFVPIYLYKNGYSLTAILVYYFMFYIFGIIADYLVAHLVALVGPKHVMRTSLLVQMLFSILLIHLDKLPFALPLLALFGCLGSTLYFIPYNVDFSKVKHRRHGGKEVGFTQVLEKMAAVLGPLLGGAAATYIAPTATFALSALAMFIATIILMLSPEAVQTRQHIKFKGLKVKENWRDFIAFSFFCAENAISILVWPIFLSLVVFTSGVYIKLGVVSAAAALTAILVAMPLGKLLDNNKGAAMVRYGTMVNSAIHLLRLATTNLGGAVFVSFANEPNTLVYRIAFLKGYYDKADDYPGFRIAFLASCEMSADVMRASTFGILALCSLHFSAYTVCVVAFVLGAIYSQLIRLQRFPALKG
jgi:hypothetical protein